MIHTLSADELRGRPEDLIHCVPWGQEVVITREGRPVAVLASMRREQAESVLSALRHLRHTRPCCWSYDTLDLDAAGAGAKDGPWQVYNEDCTTVLGRGAVFEEAQILATRFGLPDPVITGRTDGAQLLFVGLGPSC